jgi:F-type H+-transporting ATPase subunit b
MEQAAEHVAPGLGDLLWPALNFVLFVALLVYFLRGPLVEYFRARTARLREALQAGARARAEATALRAALSRDVENLPGLRERLRADMREAAELEARNLVALGRKAAERIRSDARLLAEQEFEAARQAVRADVIEEAVRQATALIRRALRPEDQERFVRDFVAEARTAS